MSKVSDPDGGEVRSRVIGMLCATGAMTAFSINDMAIKFLSGGYALHQVILIRSGIALAILLICIVPFQGGLAALRTRRLPMHLLRGAFVVVANMLFFAALAALPLAEAVAISFVSPLAITVLSVVLLHETVGPRRWAAIAVGLLGVLVILRPGTEAFQPVALLPLIGAGAYAMLHILTRKMGDTERAVTLAFYIQITFILFSAGIGLAIGDGRFAGHGGPSLEFVLRGWTWPTAEDWPVFIAIGVTSGIGSVLISQAYRLSEAALVAPFEYVAMPMAVIWGVLVFGDWPDAVSWAGIALIVGGGLYMVIREGRSGRAAPVPRARR